MPYFFQSTYNKRSSGSRYHPGERISLSDRLKPLGGSITPLTFRPSRGSHGGSSRPLQTFSSERQDKTEYGESKPGALSLVQTINKRLVKTVTKDKFEEDRFTKIQRRSLTEVLRRSALSTGKNARPSTLSTTSMKSTKAKSDSSFWDLIRQVAEEHERRLAELSHLRVEVEELQLAMGHTVSTAGQNVRSGKAHMAEDEDHMPGPKLDPVPWESQIGPDDAPPWVHDGAAVSLDGPVDIAEQVLAEKEASGLQPGSVVQKESSGRSLHSHEDELLWKPRSQPWMSPSRAGPRLQEKTRLQQPRQLIPESDAGPVQNIARLDESYGDTDVPDPDSPEKVGTIGHKVSLDSNENAATRNNSELPASRNSEMQAVSSILTLDEPAGGTKLESVTKPDRMVQLDASTPEFVTEDADSNRDGPRKMKTSTTTGTLASAATKLEQVVTGLQRLLSSGGDGLGNQKRGARRTMAAGQSAPEPLLSRLVNSTYFEVIFAIIILANACFIGAEIELLASNPSAYNEALFEVAHYTFSVLFFIELGLRIWVMRLGIFFDRDWGWHLIDVALLVHSLVEFIIGLTNGFSTDENKNVRMVRAVRVVRNVRIVRVMRLVTELRTMLYAIFGCFRALLGLICLLTLILYFFAVFFTQGATEFKLEHPQSSQDDMEKRYGSIMLSMYTLYKAMTAGVAWGDVVQPLLENVHWFYTILFLCYISFALFAVLNVVTGVFVESALRRTQEEEETRLEEEARIRNNTVGKIRDLFCEIDADESGTVSIEEFMDALNDEYVIGCFELLDIETAEAEQLFHLLDPDSEGTVEIEEFVKGCLRLKGEAKSIDIAILMCENRRLMHKFHTFMGFVAAHFDNLEEGLLHCGHSESGRELAAIDRFSKLIAPDRNSNASAGSFAQQVQDPLRHGSIAGRPSAVIGYKNHTLKAHTQDLQKVLREDDAAVQKVRHSMAKAPTALQQADLLMNANKDDAAKRKSTVAFLQGMSEGS